jgi:hypothetical protein
LGILINQQTPTAQAIGTWLRHLGKDFLDWGLPKTILNETIINDSTNEAIKIYKADINYPRFPLPIQLTHLIYPMSLTSTSQH